MNNQQQAPAIHTTEDAFVEAFGNALDHNVLLRPTNGDDLENDE